MAYNILLVLGWTLGVPATGLAFIGFLWVMHKLPGTAAFVICLAIIGLFIGLITQFPPRMGR